MTIFVVDDDVTLLSTMALELSGGQRRIVTFSDPIRALAALSRHPADLLLIDLSMPWVDGKDFIAAARRHRLNLKIVLMSGYSRGAEIAASAGVRFLRKPFELEELLTSVEATLDEEVFPWT
jgi:DNA-binding NtrC family response regulator